MLLVLGPLFGAFLEVAIFRGLQGTTDTVKLVVTVSLLFSMIGIANWIWNPTEAHNATKFFNTTRPYFIGDVPITRHELITIIVAVLVAIGLRYLLYHTRAGIAMRAAVDDRPLAALARRPPRPLVDARVGDRVLARGAQWHPLRRARSISPPRRWHCSSSTRTPRP